MVSDEEKGRSEGKKRVEKARKGKAGGEDEKGNTERDGNDKESDGRDGNEKKKEEEQKRKSNGRLCSTVLILCTVRKFIQGHVTC